MKTTKLHALAISSLIALSSQAQPFIETKAGLSTRFGPTAIVDIGTMIRPTAAYSGLIVAATTGFEAGFGASYGAYLGYQSYGLSLTAAALVLLCIVLCFADGCGM